MFMHSNLKAKRCLALCLPPLPLTPGTHKLTEDQDCYFIPRHRSGVHNKSMERARVLTTEDEPGQKQRLRSVLQSNRLVVRKIKKLFESREHQLSVRKRESKTIDSSVRVTKCKKAATQQVKQSVSASLLQLKVIGWRPVSRQLQSLVLCSQQLYFGFGISGKLLGDLNRLHVRADQAYWELVGFTQGRMGQSLSSDNQLIYITGGLIKANQETAPASQVLTFSPALKLFETLVPRRGTFKARSHHCSLIIGKKLYMIGGYNANREWISEVSVLDMLKLTALNMLSRNECSAKIEFPGLVVGCKVPVEAGQICDQVYVYGQFGLKKINFLTSNQYDLIPILPFQGRQPLSIIYWKPLLSLLVSESEGGLLVINLASKQVRRMEIAAGVMVQYQGKLLGCGGKNGSGLQGGIRMLFL